MCLITYSVTAWSINKVGNGGKVVSCKTKVGTMSVLLDFYEQKGMPEFKPIGQDAFSIAREVLIRLEKTDTRLGGQYLKRLEELKEDYLLLENIILTDTQDSNHLFIPDDPKCSVHQAAIRRIEKTQSEKRFLFKKEIWNQLLPVQQAGLLTHEIINEHLFKLGEMDSTRARKLNALLYKNQLSGNSLWTLIRDLKLPIYPSNKSEKK